MVRTLVINQPPIQPIQGSVDASKLPADQAAVGPFPPPGVGNAIVVSVPVNLLMACESDIEDHLARFLPGSRKWIFDEYFK